MEKRIAIFVLLVTFILSVVIMSSSPPVDSPIAWTNFLGLRLYADGADAGADSLNQNMLDIDDGVENNDGRIDTLRGDYGGWIVDSLIKTGANIDWSKMQTTGVDGSIIISNGGDQDWVNPGGDVDISGAGSFSIQSGVIVNNDINASAGIDWTKFKSSSDAYMFVADATGTWQSVSISGDVTIDNTGSLELNPIVEVDSVLTIKEVLNLTPRIVSSISNDTLYIENKSFIRYGNLSADTITNMVFGIQGEDGLGKSRYGDVVIINNVGSGDLEILSSGNFSETITVRQHDSYWFWNEAPDENSYVWRKLTN